MLTDYLARNFLLVVYFHTRISGVSQESIYFFISISGAAKDLFIYSMYDVFFLCLYIRKYQEIRPFLVYIKLLLFLSEYRELGGNSLTLKNLYEVIYIFYGDCNTFFFTTNLYILNFTNFSTYSFRIKFLYLIFILILSVSKCDSFYLTPL